MILTIYVKTPFELPRNTAVSTSSTVGATMPNITMDPLMESMWRRLQAEAGIDYNAPTNTRTLPILNTHQLRDESVRSLMKKNNAIRRRLMPDLYPDEEPTGVIAEDQAPFEKQQNADTNTDTDAVREQNSYQHDKSSIIGASGTKVIGTSIADIGKSISELPGEINGRLGYAGYKVDSDYNLLPANLYNNMWDYKQTAINDANNQPLPQSNDILDKFPRAVIQKDFAGVSNIFAPNFIFLGNKDDYSIGFDENMQYP